MERLNVTHTHTHDLYSLATTFSYTRRQMSAVFSGYVEMCVTE